MSKTTAQHRPNPAGVEGVERRNPWFAGGRWTKPAVRAAPVQVFILATIAFSTVTSIPACKRTQPAAEPSRSCKSKFLSTPSCHPSPEAVAVYRRCDLAARSVHDRQACCEVGATWDVGIFGNCAPPDGGCTCTRGSDCVSGDCVAQHNETSTCDGVTTGRCMAHAFVGCVSVIETAQAATMNFRSGNAAS